MTIFLNHNKFLQCFFSPVHKKAGSLGSSRDRMLSSLHEGARANIAGRVKLALLSLCWLHGKAGLLALGEQRSPIILLTAEICNCLSACSNTANFKWSCNSSKQRKMASSKYLRSRNISYNVLKCCCEFNGDFRGSKLNYCQELCSRKYSICLIKKNQEAKEKLMGNGKKSILTLSV